MARGKSEITTNKFLIISWILVVFVAMITRTIFLDGSFWMDEAAQALQSVRSFDQQHLISADFQPPLMHYLVHFLSRFSVQESWLRLASVLPGIGIILLAMDISRLMKLKHGWLAGLFLALSPFHVFFSQELRPYALGAFWVTLGVWFGLRYVQTKESKDLAGFALAHLFGWLSMYLVPFFTIFHLVWLMRRTGESKKVLKFFMIGMSPFLLWTPFLIEQFTIATTLTKTLPGWSSIVGYDPVKSLPLIALKFVFGIEGISQVGLDPFKLAFVAVGGCILLFLGIKLVRVSLLRSSINTISWLLLYPVLLSWIVSFALPILQPKRVMAAQLAVALIFPLLYTLVEKKNSRPVKILFSLGFISIIMVQILGLHQYWTDPRLQRENWRGIMERISYQFSVEKTIVVFGFTGPFAPWEWYSASQSLKFSTISFSTMPIVQDELQTNMSRALPYEHVLVFDYLRDVTDSDRSIENWLDNSGYAGVQSIDTINFGFIRHYQRPSTALQAGRETL